MADFGDAEFQGATSDPFPPPAPVPAIPATNSLPLGEDMFSSEAQAAPANGDATLEPMQQDGPAESTEDAFFQHYTPPAQAIPEPEPERADPRAEWAKQNAERLKKKEAEESAAKQQVTSKAKEHLQKFNEVRNTTLTQRKENNRKRETVVRESEVPTTGTTWEKVAALINLTSTTGHSKDMTRYKNVLLACKNNNVAIKA